MSADATTAGAVARRGTVPDAPPQDRAVGTFLRDFGRVSALYIEACVHCGMCAEACHFYEVTKDPKYTPIWKIEPMKQAYDREYGPFALFYKTLGLKRKVTTEELEQWQELIYDSCTLCGRCSLVCPMGIDIAGLIGEARHGMAAAGLVPQELIAALTQQLDADKFGQQIGELSATSGVAMPLDASKAEILCTIAKADLEHYPASIIAMAKVLNHVGASWTFRSDGFEASHAGVVSGDVEAQRAINQRIIDAAIACGATTVVLPECGHAYGALRWDGAELYGAPLPFSVQHISEFLADQVRGKRLNLSAAKQSVAFHDPCQVSRRGGALDAPREVLQALGADLRKMYPDRAVNWCCGGGGGVAAIRRADPLRHKVIELKMAQIEETGADIALTSCSTCRRTFESGQPLMHWDREIGSLLEFVAEHLVENEQ